MQKEWGLGSLHPRGRKAVLWEDPVGVGAEVASALRGSGECLPVTASSLTSLAWRFDSETFRTLQGRSTPSHSRGTQRTQRKTKVVSGEEGAGRIQVRRTQRMPLPRDGVSQACPLLTLRHTRPSPCSPGRALPTVSTPQQRLVPPRRPAPRHWESPGCADLPGPRWPAAADPQPGHHGSARILRCHLQQ